MSDRSARHFNRSHHDAPPGRVFRLRSPKAKAAWFGARRQMDRRAARMVPNRRSEFPRPLCRQPRAPSTRTIGTSSRAMHHLLVRHAPRRKRISVSLATIEFSRRRGTRLIVTEQARFDGYDRRPIANALHPARQARSGAAPLTPRCQKNWTASC